MLVYDFRWRKIDESDYEPEIIIKNGNEHFPIPLIYNSLSFSIGERYCIGYTKNNVHYDCPKNNKVENSSQCEICKKLDDTLPCTSCMGICKNIEKRAECMKKEFCLYLAIFGNILKVGISRDLRLKQRLIEQGADFGAKLASVKDGKLARIYEQKIKNYLNSEDIVSGYKKFIKSFINPTGTIKDMVEAITKLKKSNVINIPIGDVEIYDLRKYYNLHTIVNVMPKFIKIEKGEHIEGLVLAVKGNVVFMKRSDEYVCFNANDLIGREVFGIF